MPDERKPSRICRSKVRSTIIDGNRFRVEVDSHPKIRINWQMSILGVNGRNKEWLAHRTHVSEPAD